MITATQAAQYMDSAWSISLPPFLVAAACAEVEAVEPAMVDAGYSEATQVIIQCMAVTLVACRGEPRRLNSQSAPSGAARSFKNADNAMTLLRRSLAALDTAGTVAAIVGPDPASSTMLMVVC